MSSLKAPCKKPYWLKRI